MNEGELISALESWFNTPIKYKRWSRNSVGKYLKTKLTELGHWKNKKRGDPNKAIKAMKNTMLKKEFDSSFDFD